MNIRIILQALLVALVCVPAIAQDVQLSASVSQSTVTRGDQVQYTLTVTGTSIGNAKPDLPPNTAALGFTNFTSAGTQTSSQMSIDNGRITNVSNNSYIYVFKAEKEGTFTIPPATLTVKGVQYKSAPVTLTVVAAPQISAQSLQSNTAPAPRTNSANNAAPTANSGGALAIPDEFKGKISAPIVRQSPELATYLNGAVFVFPDCGKLTLYQGEQTMVNYYLMVDSERLESAGLALQSVSYTNLPDYSQFYKDEVYPPREQFRFEERTYGGRRFQVCYLYGIALTPTKTGEPTAGAFQFALFLGMRNRLNSIDVIATSPEIKFNVLPLPTDGRPADFSGGVGEFKLHAGIDKNTAKSNEDIVNLQLTVSGEGDATAIAAPQLVETETLKLLEAPKATTSKDTVAEQRVTTKKFDYLLRPTAPGQVEIPALAMSVFNPKTKKYETLRTQPMPLSVTTGTLAIAQVPVQLPSSQQPVAQQVQSIDIAFIHSDTLTEHDPATPARVRTLFLAALALLPTALVGGFALRSALSRTATTPARRKQRAFATAQRAMAQAQAAPTAERAKLCTNLLRDYFAAKFMLDPQGLTAEGVENRLLENSEIPTELCENTRHCFEQFERLQYATTASPELDEMPAQLSDLLNSVEKYLL